MMSLLMFVMIKTRYQTTKSVPKFEVVTMLMLSYTENIYTTKWKWGLPSLCKLHTGEGVFMLMMMYHVDECIFIILYYFQNVVDFSNNYLFKMSLSLQNNEPPTFSTLD